MSEETMLGKIYKKYREMKIEAADDCKFDKGNFDKNFAVTPLLIKWINKKTEWTDVLRGFEDKRKKAYRTAFEFYQNEYPTKLTSKDEYAMFVESDITYSEYMNQSMVVKEIIQFIDSTIETLKSKSWEIKTYLEWLKFKNGQ